MTASGRESCAKLSIALSGGVPRAAAAAAGAAGGADEGAETRPAPVPKHNSDILS